jgi:hypothetical protein
MDAKFGWSTCASRLSAPFRLQFTGHTMADNAFVRIDDWSRAQALADTLSPDQLGSGAKLESARAVSTQAYGYVRCTAPTAPHSRRRSLPRLELSLVDPA